MSKSKKTAANIIWFEIPADDPKRAQKFYSALFGWKIEPFPGVADYWHIDTGGGDDTPDCGKKLGGTICKGKTAVPGMGYFAICRDTENNEFALWEINMKAK